MADTPKGVTVTTVNADLGEPATSIVQHADATGIDVVEGHLIVRQGGRYVAIYAPNGWVSATLNP
ncbi:hypothetical protein ACGFI9_21895 [Micromonospora sp. NPDC048930]|uniref:hypothetical protein n=1 Tax=Micromonospora sp. NPDC048930 TaxID=3364261 RepID=UPI003712B590